MFRFILGKIRLVGPDPKNPSQAHKDYKAARVTDTGALVTSSGQIFDAAGRQKVGNPLTIFDNKNITSKNAEAWNESINGVGASVTYVQAESAVKLEVGTVSGEYAIRQSALYAPYSPGKSHEGTLTFIMGPQKANVVSRVGIFDGENGIFLERNENDERLVIRTNTSGTAVDTNFALRTNWNIDPLDGTGPSGVTIDFDKTQLFNFAFQWMGVGGVRLTFDLGLPTGPVAVHKFSNANSMTVPYMRTPNLPIRFELRNVGVSASTSELKELCSTIVSNGGYAVPGHTEVCSNGANVRSITTRSPIMAIRLKNTFEGLDNRTIVKLLDYWVYSTDHAVYFELDHVHDPTGITGTWNSVSDHSSVECSTDISVVSGSSTHTMSSGIVPAASQGGQNSPALTAGPGNFDNIHSMLTQNFDSSGSPLIFVLYGTSLSTATDVSAGMLWEQSE